MSIKKRLLALAVAGTTAVVLGGAFGLSQHATQVSAAGPSQMALGCSQNTNPAAVAFAFGAAGLGAQATTFNGAPLINNSLSLTANGLNVLNASNSLVCGVVMVDPITGAAAAPPLPATGCSAVPPVTTGDQDCDNFTVDQGFVAYTLTTAGGRFSINGTGGNFSPFAGLTTTTIQCAATAPGVTVAAGPPAVQSDQCRGAVAYVAAPGFASPNPALEITVGFAPGVPLSSFGSLTGIAGLTSGFGLSATYNRDPALTAAIAAVPAAAANAGPSSAAANLALGLVVPQYVMTLAANPTTIAANPNLNNTNPGVATTGNGGGSVITANMLTLAATNTITLNGNNGAVNIVVGGGTTAGSEPGTITFVTNNGIFGTPAAIPASAAQTVSVACGVLPGSNLVFNPATFSFGTFSFNSCTSASATLFGGGAAGTATVVATFDGAITGQQAQNAVAVAFSLQANTQALARGCDEFITPASLAANTPIATLVGTVNPSSAVVSVWQYNNASQSFNALFFSTAGAPTNGNAVSGGQSVFICVSGPASIGNGAF